MPAGAPELYKDEYCEQAYKLCILGATDKDLADFFGVCEATINNWKLRHPEFVESIKNGKVEADIKVAQSLFKKAVGGYLLHSQKAFVDKEGGEHVIDIQDEMPPDTTAAIFWLKNRQPDKWRDKQEVSQEVVVKELTIKGQKFADNP